VVPEWSSKCFSRDLCVKGGFRQAGDINSIVEKLTGSRYKEDHNVYFPPLSFFVGSAVKAKKLNLT
jgi:hypothetical protein